MIDKDFLRVALQAMEDDGNGPCLRGELHRLYCAFILPQTKARLEPQLLKPLQLVLADLWDVLTIVWRVEWQRELAREGKLNDTDWMYFAAADVREFHVGLRGLYNHVASLAGTMAARPGQVPSKSFRRLRAWLNLPGKSEKLGIELAELIKACSWFDVLRQVRDSLVHDGARPVVFPQLERITFQVYTENLQGLRLEKLMWNENLLDFELYAAVQLGQTIGFLERFASLILTKYAIPPLTAQMRQYHPALGVLKGWIGRVMSSSEDV